MLRVALSNRRIPRRSQRFTSSAADKNTDARNTMGLVLFSSICATALGLGIWQTQRYLWKVDLIEQTKIRMKTSSVPLDESTLSLLAAVSAAQSSSSSSSSSSGASRSEKSFLQADIADTSNSSDSENGENDQSVFRSQAAFAEHVKTLTGQRIGLEGQLEGHWDHSREVLVGPRGPPEGLVGAKAQGMATNPQGFLIFTPFTLSRGGKSNANQGHDDSKNGGNASESTSTASAGSASSWWWGGASTTSTDSSSASDVAGDSSSAVAGAGGSESRSGDEIEVIVNRGWVPLTALKQEGGKENANPLISRPVGPCSLGAEVIVGEAETSGRFGPSNGPQQLMERKLLWLEPKALRAIYEMAKGTGGSESVTDSSNSNSDNNGNDLSGNSRVTSSSSVSDGIVTEKDMVLLEAVEEDKAQMPEHKDTPYPVSRRHRHLGEFSVTPETHMAYAFTWFSLALAGTFMTRRLFRGKISRVRKTPPKANQYTPPTPQVAPITPVNPVKVNPVKVNQASVNSNGSPSAAAAAASAAGSATPPSNPPPKVNQPPNAKYVNPNFVDRPFDSNPSPSPPKAAPAKTTTTSTTTSSTSSTTSTTNSTSSTGGSSEDPMYGVPPGMGSLPQIDPAMIMVLQKSPEALRILQNPKMQAILQEVMKDGPMSMQKHANDPEAAQMFTRLAVILQEAQKK